MSMVGLQVAVNLALSVVPGHGALDGTGLTRGRLLGMRLARTSLPTFPGGRRLQPTTPSRPKQDHAPSANTDITPEGDCLRQYLA